MDGPVFGLAAAAHHVAGGQVHGEITLELGVVEEVSLDHVAFVAQGHHEFPEAEVGVELHDVPEDRPAADLDHRLGPGLGLLGQPRPETTGQDDDFHRSFRGGTPGFSHGEGPRLLMRKTVIREAGAGNRR